VIFYEEEKNGWYFAKILNICGIFLRKYLKNGYGVDIL